MSKRSSDTSFLPGTYLDGDGRRQKGRCPICGLTAYQLVKRVEGGIIKAGCEDGRLFFYDADLEKLKATSIDNNEGLKYLQRKSKVS